LSPNATWLSSPTNRTHLTWPPLDLFVFYPI
jgi:hypothetical protein